MIIFDTNVVSEAMKPAPHYAELAGFAESAKVTGRGFPTPDGYIRSLARVHRGIPRHRAL
jgi:predicted nucleic acid-binding protein